MRILFSLCVIVLFMGCAPVAPVRTQIPSTTLVVPVGSDLKIFYEDNIEGINCLAYFLNPKRYLIGVSYRPSRDGLIIVKVFENGPAEKAGLKEGDIITKINTKNVNEPDNVVIINAPSRLKLEIKRGSSIISKIITPALMQSNNAIETRITAEERHDDKYIYEIIDTGVELNTLEYKSHYDRSQWIVSQWATQFWGLNKMCLQYKTKAENIGLQFNYSSRNFAMIRRGKGHDESLAILSKRRDIIEFAEGDMSVQELLDHSEIFINGARERLQMQQNL